MKRCLTLAFASAGLILILAPGAWAHAQLRSSSPVKSSTNETAPDEVSARFSEPLSQSSSLQVFDSCGDRVDGGGASIEGNEITVALNSDAAGRYKVRFFVLSGLDGHPARGEFTFDVSNGTSCAANSGSGGGGADSRGIFDIPLGDLLVGLGIAALIGAAGGHVYAGIVGKRV